MKTLSIIIASLIFISSCKTKIKPADNSQTDIYGTWKLHDVELVDSTADFMAEANAMQVVQEGLTYNFFRDSTYFHIRMNGEFEHGSWYNNESKNAIYKKGKDGTSLILVDIKKNTTGKFELSIMDKASGSIQKFIKEGDAPVKDQDDPFHISNNQWRIKPSRSENSKELNERIANYIRHTALILKSSNDRDLPVVSFEYSMGPVMIYAGGIGVHPFENLPEYWVNCFYSKIDARAAYEQYAAVLGKSRYRGASSGNWIMDDYNILLTIYAAMMEKNAASDVKKVDL